MVLGRDMFADSQTQAAAAGRFVAAFVHAIETLKDALLLIFRNADPGVVDGEAHVTVAARMDGHEDFAAFFVVFHGIVDAIHDELVEKRLVSVHENGLGVDADGDVFRGGLRRDDACGVFGGRLHVDRFPRDGRLAFFHARKVHDGLDEAEHAVRFVQNAPGKQFRVVFARDEAARNHFGKAADGGERGLELMGDVRGKFAAHFFGGMRQAHVVEHDEKPRLVVGEIDGNEGNAVRFLRDIHRVALAAAFFVGELDGAEPIFVVVEPGDFAVENRIGVAENVLRHRIGIDDFFVFVQKQNAVGDGIDDGADGVPFFFEVLCVILDDFFLFADFVDERPQLFVSARHFALGGARHDVGNEVFHAAERAQDGIGRFFGDDVARDANRDEEEENFRNERRENTGRGGARDGKAENAAVGKGLGRIENGLAVFIFPRRLPDAGRARFFHFLCVDVIGRLHVFRLQNGSPCGGDPRNPHGSDALFADFFEKREIARPVSRHPVGRDFGQMRNLMNRALLHALVVKNAGEEKGEHDGDDPDEKETAMNLNAQ